MATGFKIDAPVTLSETAGTGAKGVCVHGAVAGTARPVGFASIEWQGTVVPTNAVATDTWIDTST